MRPANVRLLIERGANLNLREESEYRALEKAQAYARACEAEIRPDSLQQEPNYRATKEIIRLLLAAQRAETQAQAKPHSPTRQTSK